jgi:hypothetical protein
VKLGAEGLRVFRGEAPKVKADGTGEVDRSATLMKIGRVLYDAGANRTVLVAALRERDLAFYKKYTYNRDGGEAEYHRIVDKLEEEGRNARVKWRSKAHSEDVLEIASSSGVLEGKGNQADRLVGYALESGAELFRAAKRSFGRRSKRSTPGSSERSLAPSLRRSASGKPSSYPGVPGLRIGATTPRQLTWRSGGAATGFSKTGVTSSEFRIREHSTDRQWHRR